MPTIKNKTKDPLIIYQCNNGYIIKPYSMNGSRADWDKVAFIIDEIRDILIDHFEGEENGEIAQNIV